MFIFQLLVKVRLPHLKPSGRAHPHLQKRTRTKIALSFRSSRLGNQGRGIVHRDKMAPNVGLEVTDTDPLDLRGGLGVIRSARIAIYVSFRRQES